MNGSVKCVDNQGINIECMHVKCKSIVTIMWNNYTRIKFHFYQLYFHKLGPKKTQISQQLGSFELVA
jgi:hypothetical protein